jgi:hypothetical protein
MSSNQILREPDIANDTVMNSHYESLVRMKILDASVEKVKKNSNEVKSQNHNFLKLTTKPIDKIIPFSQWKNSLSSLRLLNHQFVTAVRKSLEKSSEKESEILSALTSLKLESRFPFLMRLLFPDSDFFISSPAPPTKRRRRAEKNEISCIFEKYGKGFIDALLEFYGLPYSAKKALCDSPQGSPVKEPEQPPQDNHDTHDSIESELNDENKDTSNSLEIPQNKSFMRISCSTQASESTTADSVIDLDESPIIDLCDSDDYEEHSKISTDEYPLLTRWLTCAWPILCNPLFFTSSTSQTASSSTQQLEFSQNLVSYIFRGRTSRLAIYNCIKNLDPADPEIIEIFTESIQQQCSNRSKFKMSELQTILHQIMKQVYLNNP